MNKTVIVFMLSCMLVLTACGKTNEKNNADTGTNQIENNTAKDSAGNSSKEGKSPDSSTVESITDIVEYYKNKGMAAEITTDKYAEIIGAKEGVGVKINGQSVEIYEFNPTSDALKAVKETNVLLERKAITNDNFVLIAYADNEEIAEIQNMFKSLNTK